MEQTQQSTGHTRKLAKSDYLKVFIGLVIATSIELGLTFITDHPIVIAILVVLSLIKIILVALYYMHLYSDNKWLAYIFLVPIPFVALIFTALVLSYIR